MIRERSSRFDSLCRSLDGIKSRAELVAFGSKHGLAPIVFTDGSVQGWSGESMGAKVEILVVEPAPSSKECAVSTLVTVDNQVEHVRLWYLGT